VAYQLRQNSASWCARILACSIACAAGCRATTTAPTDDRSVVVVAPRVLEASVRAATLSLTRLGPPIRVEVRVATAGQDGRALEGADVVVAHSQAGLSVVAEKLSGKRVSFGCEDEVVLIGAPGSTESELKPTLEAASTVLLADSRGEGEAAEAALARTGRRAAVAGKLRYLGSAADVVAEVAQGKGVGLVLRSDLRRAGDAAAIVTSGFDGQRACPTAARLATAPHPSSATRVLALLTSTTTAGASPALHGE
jgi:hypothetical protein